MLARSLVSSNTFSLTRVGANVSGGAIAEDLYVNSREELDALLIANGVAEADVVSTWDAIWPVLIDPDTGVEYTSAAAADNQIYNQGGILKSVIVAAIPSGYTGFDFEETGAPSGWSSSTPAGVVDFDYTSSPIDGLKSLYIEGGSFGTGADAIWDLGEDQPDISIKYQLNIKTLPDAAENRDSPITYGTNQSGSASWSVYLRYDGKFFVRYGLSTGTILGSNTYSLLTDYYIWVDVVKNDDLSLYVSATNTKPGTPEATLALNPTLDTGKVIFRCIRGCDIVVDNVEEI